MSAVENVIEFLIDQDVATLTISKQSIKSKIRALAERYPDQVRVDIDENNGGYMLAHLPVSFIRFRGPMKLTEDERQRRAENMSKMKE